VKVIAHYLSAAAEGTKTGSIGRWSIEWGGTCGFLLNKKNLPFSLAVHRQKGKEVLYLAFAIAATTLTLYSYH
jgi:hypothetical protein